MIFPTTPHTVIIRRPEVERRCGIKRSTLYNKMNPKSPFYDHSFPARIKLGASAIGWSEAEIQAWIDSRIALSRQESSHD